MSRKDSSNDLSAEKAKRHAEKASRKVSPWIDGLARAGYVAKGVVYVVIGVLAIREATNTGGKTTGTSGAFQSLGTSPFGKVLLLVLAAGLVGYALWKLVQGVMDPEDKGNDFTGIVRRAAYVGSALIYGGLAFTAAQEVIGAEGKKDSKDDLTAQILGYYPPLGQILVALVGLVVIGVGVYQLHAALTSKFMNDLKLGDMSEVEEHWTTSVGSIGTTARAIVIFIAGGFVILAAYQSDPSEASGLGGAPQPLSATLRPLPPGRRRPRPHSLRPVHVYDRPLPAGRTALIPPEPRKRFG